MPTDRTRRALLAAALGIGTGAALTSSTRSYLDQFAPLSGSVWSAADRTVEGTISGPYGDAEVRYDDHGVPHVTADSERALYHAVGYCHGADRLFGMDAQRRLMRGETAEVFGELTADSDEFHVRMDFVGAAEANLELLDGTETGAIVEAYCDGVNAAIERESLPVEFRLLEYEPEPWTPTDAMLMETQIAWSLTGSFRTLRNARATEALSEELVAELSPDRMDHDAPIVRERERNSADSLDEIDAGDAPNQSIDPELTDWLSRFESPDGVGSNSWVVAGDHTDDGRPIVANDPHLQLSAPPIWYEANLRTDEFSVRGVGFPGQPFVVIGENHAGAWGVTNVGADVTDFYTYETDGGSYRYGDEWREFETEERTIAVADGEDREITTRKSVHGPVVEREGSEVAVAWTGLSASETVVAIREYARSDGIDEFLDATRKFDLPTQNVVYADEDGNTLYYVTGRIPIRRIDGEPVRGDRVFDGSEGEGEWAGFEPYGVSSWDGFVPFAEKPGVLNPDYLGTANQRVIDEPEHYLGDGYGTPFRGARLYDRLDELIGDGDAVDADEMAALQLDTYDRRADLLVPALLAVRSALSDPARDAVDSLEEWNRRMDRESTDALYFSLVLDRFREIAFGEPFAEVGLDASYAPNDWVALTLDDDSRWFGQVGVPDRSDALVEAAEAAVEDADEYDDYGDYNRLSISHYFDQPFLNYPDWPTDGSPATLRNYRRESAVGASWRMVAVPGGDSRAILPGGNDGDYFSDQYDDQLRAWNEGEFKPMSREIDGELALRFEEGDE